MSEKKLFFYLIIFFSYLSFIAGFYLDENITSGAIDWPHVTRMIENFSNNFENYFRNYENRHSPLFYILLSFFRNFDLSFDLIRFIHLHLNFLTLIVTYYCFRLKLNYSINKISILFLSIVVILLSPNLRTAAYWPLPYSLALFFLIVSFYFCLKFLYAESNQDKKIYYIGYNIFFVILSSYISPNFSLFSIFFSYLFLKKEFNKKTIILIFFGNLVLSLPALYYFFIYNPFFIFNNSVHPDSSLLRFNYFNKLIIISSIIFFHLMPFLIKIDIQKILESIKKHPILIILSLIFFFLSLFYFNFKLDYGGGGVFLKFSYLFFKNDYLFLFFYFFIFYFTYFLIVKNLNNFILIIIFILMNPQLSIYHKYYDPLVLIVFLLFFDLKIFKKDLIEKKMIFFLFLFLILFNFLYVLKNYV